MSNRIFIAANAFALYRRRADVEATARRTVARNRPGSPVRGYGRSEPRDLLVAPVGRTAHLWVCGTTPCMLRGSEALIEICKERIAEHPHELSKDGRFSWEEVECLGCCSNAPVVQIGKDTYEDLDPELFEKLLYALRQGKPVKPGSQTGRKASCPAGGATTLKEIIDKVAEKV